MRYLTVQQTSKLWGTAARQVQNLCRSGRINGAVRFGREWAIPEGTPKPPDGRRNVAASRQALTVTYPSSAYTELFQNIIRHFPYPIHIAAADGTLIEANEAFYTFFQVPDNEKLYRTHNILHDPDLEKWGIKEYVQKAFRGEIVELFDIKVPVHDLVRRFSDKGLSNEEIYQNMTSFPIFNGAGKLECVVTMFSASRVYTGKEAIRESKAYMDAHWFEKFDIEKIADSVFLSKYYFARLFKKYSGITPYGYYQEIKIRKLKEKLRSSGTTVSQAFTECGLDYSGYYSRLFREKVGVTPSQYKRSDYR